MNDTPATRALPNDALLAGELASEEMVEMANLTEAQTGVPGIILISTAIGAHGPRVKYSAQPGFTQLGFTVSIADRPRVTAPMAVAPPKAADLLEIAPQVVQWVLQNNSSLLDFWHHGDTWSQPEVNAFVQRLQRVDMTDEVRLSDLHRKTVHNKEWLSNSEVCGCCYCLRVFSFNQIKSFTDKCDTAICPFCAVDCIIALPDDADKLLLKAMHDRWFGRSSYCFTDDADEAPPRTDKV